MKLVLATTIVIGLYICASIYGCAQSATPTRLSASAGSDSGLVARSTDHTQETLAFSERHPRYKVMRDDVLALTFPLSPELNQTVSVQPDGYVSLTSAGSIYVQGLTVPEVAATIKKAYVGILNDPIIDVDLKDFQKPFFVVSGQVGKPGQYDLRYDITVTQAISIAGGTTPDAKGQAFLFHRVSDDLVEVKKLDTASILNGKNVNEDIHVQPGDMIVVPTTFITKFKRYVPYTMGFYLNAASSLL